MEAAFGQHSSPGSQDNASSRLSCQRASGGESPAQPTHAPTESHTDMMHCKLQRDFRGNLRFKANKGSSLVETVHGQGEMLGLIGSCRWVCGQAVS